MNSSFWKLFGVVTALKVLLLPAYHSTDFEVHRNWLAITFSLPLKRWYLDATSQWTLDYPPFFAYFEWVLAQVAYYVDPHMLVLDNHNYDSENTVYFQRGHFTGEVLLLFNVGLIFVDHIHFQYNGFLFGLLLLSIAFLLERRFLQAAFTFALLLNFKHIFLYMAPAFAVYLLRFYCLDASNNNPLLSMAKLIMIGLTPFALAFGPFWNQIPQVMKRLFPFQRGLTHAYWAPNFWALYNAADKVATAALRIPRQEGELSTSSGLVQEFKHVVLPTITPVVTFMLTAVFMVPILVKLLCFTSKRESRAVFLRAIVLCSCASFMFGWHVHEKAILMCLVPLCLLCLLDARDAKYAFLFSVIGYFSLFPLLFHIDLLVVRYSLYLAYVSFMYAQLARIHGAPPKMNLLEDVYVYGFVALPFYEHLLSPLLGWHKKLPFMPLLLTSIYCGVGVAYCFIRYYQETLSFTSALDEPKTKNRILSKTDLPRRQRKSKAKLKQK